MDKPSIDWETWEYNWREKSPDWFWYLGIVAVAGVVLSLFVGNFLLAIIIILSAICLMIYGARPPELVSFQIDNRGVQIKQEFYPFKNIQSFWIFTERPDPQLLLNTRRWIFPHLIIPLGDTDPEAVRQVLLNYLPEVEEQESLIDVFSERIGF